MIELDNWIVIFQVFLTGLTAALALVPAWFRMKSERRKENATAAGVVTDAALGIMKAWQDRVVTLESTVARMDREIRTWRRGYRLIVEQMTNAGLVPCWVPPEEDPED